MPRRNSPYGPAYQKARAAILAGNPICAHINCTRPASEADHQPPLSRHRHRNGSGCCRLLPSCGPCQRRQAIDLANGKMAAAPLLLVVDEPVGFDESSAVWDVAPWLDDLRVVPEDGWWPRLMSVPHRDAVDSYGPEFDLWCQVEHGVELYWWQLLAATRILEHDAAGELVWAVVLLTVARQCGKSELGMLLCDWRSEQSDRFGEPQLVLHTAKTLQAAQILMDRATPRAESHGWPRRLSAGEHGIRKVDVAGEWLIRSQVSTVGYSTSLAYADEAFGVKLKHVQQNLSPTTVEKRSGQLLLASTAHSECTDLIPTYRAEAIDELDSGDGTLLLEWSAARHADLADEVAWAQASPHWTKRRDRDIRAAVRTALPYMTDGPGMHELVAGVYAQWFNVWPLRGGVEGRGERLLLDGLWASFEASVAFSEGPVFVAVVDNHGQGAATAVVQVHKDRVEVGGVEGSDWDAAWDQAAMIARLHPRSTVLFGDGMVPDLKVFPAGTKFDKPARAATRLGLPLLRSMASAGRLVHDRTAALDAQVESTKARRVVRSVPAPRVRSPGRVGRPNGRPRTGSVAPKR
jgi:hypothetical protein